MIKGLRRNVGGGSGGFSGARRGLSFFLLKAQEKGGFAH
ncbi:Uncharacterized protein PPKH_3063 [Pseudomonas putida]|nr:Uncharacterized protein PPKH_3063 [Pseudomonas putida]